MLETQLRLEPLLSSLGATTATVVVVVAVIASSHLLGH
jgi:hypothetical protein